MRNTINTKQKLGLGYSKKRDKVLSDGWTQNLAYELDRPIQRKFKKRCVVSNGIDEIWAADLVEMGKFSKWNKGIKYLVMVIDVLSKFGWIGPLKAKKGETVAKAFQNIFKSGRLPRKIWTDKGTEFYNRHVNELLKAHEITLYSTENEERKSSVVERWNKTMKNKMWRMFSANNNTVYFDKLGELVDDYNNTKHRSIQTTPSEACRIINEMRV